MPFKKLKKRLDHSNAYYQVNKESLNDKRRQRYQKIKENIFKILGIKCVTCGFEDIRALQIDHIKGGGSKERKAVIGLSMYSSILKEIVNGKDKYQILCANCNWIKRSINNENRK